MRGVKYYLRNYYFPITLAISIVTFLMVLVIPDAKNLDLIIITVLVGSTMTTILIVINDKYEKSKPDEES